MTAPDDIDLLRRYASMHSEAAFAELVQRHLDRVYALALRQVGGDAHLAKDVTQLVFTALARKAASLTDRPVLGGWLYVTARFAARDVVRSERRRRMREEKAHAMNEIYDAAEIAPDHGQVRRAVDQAMGELKTSDRDAIWLRFFEGLPLAEVGGRLHLTENSARMRVDRALERMRRSLAKRGVNSTAAALAAAFAGPATMAAPAGLVSHVTGAALAGTAIPTGAGFYLFMNSTKLLLGASGALTAAVIAGLAVQWHANTRLHAELAAAMRQDRQDVAALRTQNAQLSSQAAQLRPQADEAAAEVTRLLAAMDRFQAATAQNPTKASEQGASDYATRFLQAQALKLQHDEDSANLALAAFIQNHGGHDPAQMAPGPAADEGNALRTRANVAQRNYEAIVERLNQVLRKAEAQQPAPAPAVGN